MNASECDLCGHHEFTKIGDLDRHGNPLSTVACQKCGLVRHEVVPTEEELQAFYSSGYREEYNGERTPGVRRIMRAWNNGERIRDQVAGHLNQGGRVLEIGAGIGCTVKVFENAGFEAEGIDPGGEFLSFSRERLNARVEVCNLYDLSDEARYDAILLVHVIEHLRSPKAAFQKIAKMLKPGGMFYVECPNLQAPFASRSRLFHTAHIHNYVPSTLQMLGESCGFDLVQRFGDDRDTNLQMLFRNSGNCRLEIDQKNYERTLDDLKLADTVPYLLRPRYVVDRVVKLASYGREHLTAGRFVDTLIQKCRSKSTSEPETVRRAA